MPRIILIFFSFLSFYKKKKIMSKSTTKNSSVLVPTIWKRFPHRIKGLLKRDIFYSNSPPAGPSSSPTIKNYNKSSSLIYRMFPNSHKSKKKDTKFIQHHQWVNNHDCHVELDICHEVPLRANLMSLFHSQEDWSLPNERLDGVSRVYIGTLGKLRLLNQYAMEHQIAIHHLLSSIQSNSSNKKLLPRAGHAGSFQRDFHSLLSGKVHESSSLLLNRKPRRTRYIFMLLSTPASHVVDKVHPVSDAIAKLRKPYAETTRVLNSSEFSPPPPPPPPPVKEVYKCVSPDYLLDPASLRGGPSSRSASSYSSATNQENDPYNQDAASIAPFMAKIQIQTN